MKILFLSALVAVVLILPLQADTFGSGANQFTIDFTTIGNAGNAADPLTGYGAVPYTYKIGTYSVSQDQVNAATANGLQNVTTSTLHDAIQLVSPSYCPATHASWFEAAAFANWLDTSSGYAPAYNLSFTNGSWSMSIWSRTSSGYNAANPFRNQNAVYFLPSVDEWYKAAYYSSSSSSYYLYTTGSNIKPVQVSNTGTGKGGAGWNNGGAGTDAGTTVYGLASWAGFAPTTQSGGLSPYGTMGQGGNNPQWTETSISGNNSSPNETRIGLGYTYLSDAVSSTNNTEWYLSPSFDGIGIRIAANIQGVPEPSTYALLGLGIVGTLLAVRRKRLC